MKKTTARSTAAPASTRSTTKKLDPAKKKPKVKKPVVLAYDLGGTKIAVGVVDLDGKILAFQREVAFIKQGKQATLDQLIRLGKFMIEKFPEISHVGIACAGPLDPVAGDLLDPTNFSGPEGNWERVPLTTVLAKGLKKKVILENDAAAAILAEIWKGLPEGTQNAMILTLGTGLGTAVVANGELVRGGRHLHTEGGHMIIRAGDQSAPCGCGQFGCAEAYLAGRTFAYRGRKRLGSEIIDAPQIAARARDGDPVSLELFDEYSELLATALHNYIMLFYPEVVVFTGSFAAAHDLFLKNTEKKLAKMLVRRNKVMNLQPKLVISKLENQAGLLGGAYVAFRAMRLL
ncbi:MAG: ROK family protein [Cryobacterium sp.]|nr:ROK family protein [Oligoflexia bacterium]